MIRAMIVRIPMQTAAAGVRHVAVSLPYVGFLLADQPDKYLRPEDLPPTPTARHPTCRPGRRLAAGP